MNAPMLPACHSDGTFSVLYRSGPPAHGMVSAHGLGPSTPVNRTIPPTDTSVHQPNLNNSSMNLSSQVTLGYARS